MIERFIRKVENDARPPVMVGTRPLSIDDVVDVASGGRRIVLDPDPAYRARLDRSVASLREQLFQGKSIYGVTTGFGASCTTTVSAELLEALPRNLVRFHGCGTGTAFGDRETAAVLVARLASLARGFSAVRPLVLERLCEFLNRGVLPVIPAEGSVGASGDLTPLSYVAATLTGEREVRLNGEIRPAAAVLSSLGIEPLALAPKESLAIMNGTSVMTGLGCLAYHRTLRLSRLSCAVTALMSAALRGNRGHFDARIFDLKPHPGTKRAAAWIREHLGPGEGSGDVIQDRYSLRCAPHVIGVALDGLEFARTTLEIELNGVNDNPIILSESNAVLHSGNFYGGHVAFVMDALKIAIANLADLLDRQVALVCNPSTNNGLPADLVAVAGSAGTVHHGFKAMQISASALAAEALKQAVPASLFSRSTESHNQDKVSMGTVAARDCLRVLELTEATAAVALLAACQAYDLRAPLPLAGTMGNLHDFVRRHVPKNTGDRRQDLDIDKVLELYEADMLPLRRGEEQEIDNAG